MPYYVAGISYGNDLYHHGVKGQRLGIRRYQNPDGTLTTEGKARYGKEALPSNAHDSLRRLASGDFGPIKNSMLRGKREERLKNKLDKLKSEGASKYDIRRAESKAKAQEKRNKDYEQYTAKTSTAKLIAQALLVPGHLYGARKYREARARGASRVRAMMSSTFFFTPVGFAATKISEKKKYGEFVHSDESNNELYHWGIRGQKWGIRRYQNPDGTLTEEGKERYRKHPEEAVDYVKKNWVKSYNEAVDESNSRLNKLNDKYKDIDFAKDEQAYVNYVDEYDQLMRDVFGKKFDKDFGEITEVAGLGRDYAYKTIMGG